MFIFYFYFFYNKWLINYQTDKVEDQFSLDWVLNQ